LQEAVFKGLQGKVPKGVAACVDVLLQALRAFGPRVVKPTPLLKAAGPLFDHKDKAVRDGAKDVAVELTRWLGAAAVRRDLTDKMRDSQKEEVVAALDAVSGSAPTPTRCLRRDAARFAAAAASSVSEAAPGGAASTPTRAAAPAGAPGVDVYDLVEPEEILSKLAKKGEGDKPPFAKGAVSENWKLRHAAFSDLKALASAVRLAPGDYGEATRLIRRVLLQDANVAVVGEAADAAAALARGLRRGYRGDARVLLPAVLDKLKDKTTNVIRALRGALDAFAEHCVALPDVADDIVTTGLEHKVIKVQVETLGWLAAALRFCGRATAERLRATALMPALLKMAEAPTPDVRDAAVGALAALAAAGGGAATVVPSAEAARVDAARLRKIEELVAGMTLGGETDAPGRPQFNPDSPLAKVRAAPAGAAAKPRSALGAAKPSAVRAPVAAPVRAAPAPARAAPSAAAPRVPLASRTAAPAVARPTSGPRPAVAASAPARPTSGTAPARPTSGPRPAVTLAARPTSGPRPAAPVSARPTSGPRPPSQPRPEFNARPTAPIPPKSSASGLRPSPQKD
jgi:cytoskeleton-associated protein 5